MFRGYAVLSRASRSALRIWLAPAVAPIFNFLMSANLKRRTNKCENIEDKVEIILASSRVHQSFPWKVTSQQVNFELKELMKMVKTQNPKFILEIGTCEGGTLFLLARASSPSSVIISIDLLTKKHDRHYPWWKSSFYKTFAADQQQIHIMREDSHLESTLNKTEAILKGKKLDFLFIDGDHTYGGVKKDFEMYSKLVRKGGLIAFHDICHHPPETGCEVDKFWSEIKNNYENVEIIEDLNQKWAGIGVLRV